MKAITLRSSEKLHSQSEARMGGRTNTPTEKIYAAHEIGKACQRAHWCIFLKILTIFPGVACGPCPTFNSSLTTPPAITCFLGCFCCCFGDSVEFV